MRRPPTLLIPPPKGNMLVLLKEKEPGDMARQKEHTRGVKTKPNNKVWASRELKPAQVQSLRLSECLVAVDVSGQDVRPWTASEDPVHAPLVQDRRTSCERCISFSSQKPPHVITAWCHDSCYKQQLALTSCSCVEPPNCRPTCHNICPHVPPGPASSLSQTPRQFT